MPAVLFRLALITTALWSAAVAGQDDIALYPGSDGDMLGIPKLLALTGSNEVGRFEGRMSGADYPVTELTFMADATQAVGWLPVDAAPFDVLAVSAYKWLMCPRGTAFCYVSPAVRDRIRPLAANWYAGDGDASYGPPLRLAEDARRFDIAAPWFSYVAAAPTLELLLEIGVGAIHEHDVRMADRFRAGLGMPSGDSAIVTVTRAGAAERLAEAGVRASVRKGAVRLAFHLYTTEADVDTAVAALS